MAGRGRASRPPSTSGPRRRRRRWAASVALGLVIALAGVGTDAALVLGRIERFPITPPIAAAPGPKVWVIVGVDDRSAPPPGPDVLGAAPPGERADIVLLAVRVDGRYRLLSIPRDLIVDKDGHSAERLTDVMTRSRQAFMNAMCRTIGVASKDLLLVKFPAFVGVVDAVQGVTVDTPHGLRDRRAHIRLEPGQHTLDGGEALAYVRSRHALSLVDGRWVEEQKGFYGRQNRAAEIASKLAAKLRAMGDPLLWRQLAVAAIPSIALSAGANPLDLLGLRDASLDYAILPTTDYGNQLAQYATAETHRALAEFGITTGCVPAG